YRDGGRGQRENRVAQVGPGEVADIGAVGDLGSKLLFAWSADYPYPMALGGKPARQIGVSGSGPTLGGPNRAGRERNDRPPIGRKPQPRTPSAAFGRGHLEFRQWPLCSCGLALGQG